MRKNKLFLSLLMAMLLSVGNVWADADVTYDFTGSGWSVSNGALTNGTVSFTGEGSANFKMSTGYFMMGKSGAYITFPAYSKPVEKIVVTGRSGASASTKMNIFVDDATVSTETTGSTSANTYEIASASQVAGTIYTLKVTSAHNAQITKIEVFYVSEGSGDEPGGGDDPAPVSSNWTKVEPGDLATNDIVVIVGNDSKAMSNDQGTSAAPTAVAVTVADDKLSADPADNIKWTVTVSNGSFEFATGDNHLYCTNTNNGVRVGTNANSAFTISTEGYLYNTATLRYVGVYNNADWRCYTSINSNIKDQTFSFFKESDGSTPKPAAGLAYDEADQKKLAKLGNAFTAPTLTNPHSVAVTYSSNNTDVAEVAANGAVTLKATGVAIITASFAGDDDYKAGSASYTIGVTSHAGTETDPYVAADAKIAIDVKGTVENAYATGIVCNIVTTALPAEGYITFFFSADGATTGQQVEAYKCYGLSSAPFEALTNVKTGATVVVTGTLKKYNSTYEFDANCHLVSYEAPAVPKTPIANDQANPYTVAQAITYTADGVTYDLDDYVYVQGVVYDVKNFSNGAMDIFIKDANAENQFELYKCAGINDGNATTPFDELTDVQVGDVVIGYGQLTVYNSVYEFKQGNYLVDLDREEVVLTDYYEKVTETAGITDGTYLIVYEEGSLAFNGGLETLDAANNTIGVTIVGGNKIGVTTATEAATFFIDVTAGSILAANGKYIGVTSNSNGLKQSDNADAYANAFAIDASGNAVISAVFENANMTMRYNKGSGQERFRYYGNGQQPIQLYKLANETIKANPELAWSAESVEITLGETFTAPTLDNPHSVAGITYASDNEALATVTSAGVISLVADATGTAHITATFAGNDDYKAANVSCTIIVNSSTPTPAETKNVVIIAEYNSKFYAMTNSLSNGALAAVEVEKDGDKIVVMAEADKAAIQWTMTDNTTTATFQDAEDKYLAHSGTGTNLALQDAAENWTWSENGYYYAVENRTFFYSNSGVFKNYSATNLPADKTDYSGAPEIIEIAAEDIILSQKANPQLAYTPSSVTLTVGGTFTPAVLSYTEGFDGLAAVTYASNNEALATVNESGVVSLVAAATGTATITATFAGNNNYQAGSASYTITVNEAGDDLSGTWALVTDVEQLAAGKKVVIAYCGLEGNYLVAKTMGAQNTNNRAAVESSTKTATDYTSLTLGSGTKVFTLVDAGDGKFAIKASNGNYLTSATSGTSNNLLEAADYELDNAKWTISISNEVASIVAAAGNKTVMQYNSGSTIFSCYGTASQKPVRIYMLQEDTPEPPTPDWTEVRSELTIGKHYTICLKKRITAVNGATFWTIGKHTAHKVAYLEEAQLPLIAGEPFIFQATADKLEVVYEGEDVDNPVTVEGNALRGTFEDMDAAALAAACTNMYMLSNNQICSVTHNNGNFLSAFRAYIDDAAMSEVSSAPQPAPGRKVKSVPMQGNVATGIDETHTSMQAAKMLIDGQLFIIYGEKMYDVTGSLVK